MNGTPHWRNSASSLPRFLCGRTGGRLISWRGVSGLSEPDSFIWGAPIVAYTPHRGPAEVPFGFTPGTNTASRLTKLGTNKGASAQEPLHKEGEAMKCWPFSGGCQHWANHLPQAVCGFNRKPISRMDLLSDCRDNPFQGFRQDRVSISCRINDHAELGPEAQKNRSSRRQCVGPFKEVRKVTSSPDAM